jgi:hypothetical protein
MSPDLFFHYREIPAASRKIAALPVLFKFRPIISSKPAANKFFFRTQRAYAPLPAPVLPHYAYFSQLPELFPLSGLGHFDRPAHHFALKSLNNLLT